MSFDSSQDAEEEMTTTLLLRDTTRVVFDLLHQLFNPMHQIGKLNIKTKEKDKEE